MKIAVYNRHWGTLGGGERYSGFLAQCLAANNKVDLLVHAPLELAELEEKLELDLTKVAVKDIGRYADTRLQTVSAEYDLLFNASFKSSSPSAAGRSIYVVYFPVPYEPVRQGIKDVFRRNVTKSKNSWVAYEWGPGWLPTEYGRQGPFRWSTGPAGLRFYAPEGIAFTARLVFGGYRPRGLSPGQVEVEVDGRPAGREQLSSGGSTSTIPVSITGLGVEYPVYLSINSDLFSPQKAGLGEDSRTLGAPLLRVEVEEVPQALKTGTPQTGSLREPIAFLKTYDRLISISTFTQQWVKKLWGEESEVLHPPVSPQTAGRKAPIILSVGRFFDSTDSHSKKQLEMVGAFRRMCSEGLIGWEYHLVGGCDGKHTPYLNQVEEAAAGLPVRIHNELSRSELRRLYRQASVFWHATGLGEADNRHPDRFEHFGISTVEAMSAGAVPMVSDRGGQVEIVEDGVNGKYFSTADELVKTTWQSLSNPVGLVAMACAAIKRAKAFSPEAFEERLNILIDRTLTAPRAGEAAPRALEPTDPAFVEV